MGLALRLLAALASGLVLTVISPPMNLHWLHWFAFVPLLWAPPGGELRRNLLLSYAAGYVAVFSLFSWLSDTIIIFSSIPAPVAWLLVGVFAFFFAFPYAIVFGSVHPFRQKIGSAWVFAIPALQVATEFLAPALFPYYQGVSQYRTPETWQLASVTGVYGVSYLVLLTNCALAEALYRAREGRPVPWAVGLVTAGLWLGNVAYGAWRVPRVDALVDAMPRIRVTQLQQGITMKERMQGSARDAMLSWVKMTSQLIGQDMDLVIWPEGATPYDPRGARVGSLMTNLARSLDAPIVFGGGFAERKTDPDTGRVYIEQRNSIYLLDDKGELLDRYDKMVPLPFGEYLPLADTFPILREWIKGPGDFRAGEVPLVFQFTTHGGQEVRFTTPICYEAILSSFVRKQLSDADLFVNVTNDGWFGDTAAPHQHGMLSAVRAVELGVPMVRLAYTGVSFNVSPTGRITNETEPFTEVIRIIESPVGRVDTVYRHIGDVFAWLCTLAAGGILLSLWRDRRAARGAAVTPGADPA